MADTDAPVRLSERRRVGERRRAGERRGHCAGTGAGRGRRRANQTESSPAAPGDAPHVERLEHVLSEVVARLARLEALNR
jgi:hypothetical protein